MSTPNLSSHDNAPRADFCAEIDSPAFFAEDAICNMLPTVLGDDLGSRGLRVGTYTAESLGRVARLIVRANLDMTAMPTETLQVAAGSVVAILTALGLHSLIALAELSTGTLGDVVDILREAAAEMGDLPPAAIDLVALDPRMTSERYIV